MTTTTKRGPGRPPVSREGTARLVAYVAPTVKAELEAQAARLGTSAGELVREAVERHLPRVRRREPTE